jgi:hypothetical protein
MEIISLFFHSFGRRSFGLIVLCSFLLLSGTFALFDSLLDDSGEEERPNIEDNENGEELTDNDVKVGFCSFQNILIFGQNYLNQFGYIEGQERVAADQRKSRQIYSVSILFFSSYCRHLCPTKASNRG